MYTIYFYKNYPFMQGGQRVPWVPEGTTADSINNYFNKLLVATFNVTDRQFTSNQERIAVADYNAIKDCNYCRVYSSQTDETLNYFITNIVVMTGAQGKAPAPAWVYIEEDDFFNNFYGLNDSNAVEYPTVRGRIVQYAGVLSLPYDSDQLERQSPVAPIFRGINLKYAAAETADSFAYIARVIDQNGYIYNLTYQGTKEVMSSAARQLGAATILHLSASEEVNISTINLYCVPASWVEPFGALTSFNTLVETSDGQTILTCRILTPPASGISKVAEYVTPYFPSYAKLWVKTPAQAIELVTTQYWATDQRNRVSIYMEVSDGGNMSNELTIYMSVNGELVDITNDYTMDFAINEQAAYIAQHKGAVATNTVANVIGAIGGVIGGVSSGNYFGAVSAAASGVAGVTGQFAGLKTPANMTNAGSAANALSYNLICFVYDNEPANLEEIQYELSRHGWIYPSQPYKDNVEVTATHGAFVKINECEVVGAFDSNAATRIADKFTAGVKFIAIDTTP